MPIPTLKYLDDILTILGSTNTFFWPFLEATGIAVQSYGEEDMPVVPGEAGADVELNDPVTGWAPFKHVGGVHSYHFEGGDDQHLYGADAAKLSFNGTTDAAFSIGCWFYTEGATGTLIAKYDVAGTDREWRLHLLSGPDLGLEVFEEGIDDSETAQATTALSTRQWYFGVVTYGGAGGDGGGGSAKTAAADMVIYIDGAAVAATTSEVGAAYADMDAGSAVVMIGATDDNAAPANEFTGRIALPFITGKELTPADVRGLYSLGQTLLGLA
jgi:hypothetical protein